MGKTTTKQTEQQTPKRRGRKPGFRLPPPTLHPDATHIRPNQFRLETGMSRATLYRLAKSDKTFPPLIKLSNGATVINRAALRAWMDSKSVTAEVAA